VKSVKKNYLAIIMSLVFVLCVSIGAYIFFTDNNAYKPDIDGYCANERVSEDMSRTEMAKIYKDSCVAVIVESKAPDRSYTNISSGSGVCVASEGYQTEYKHNAKQSYFATNYHVISYACDPMYSSYKTEISIELDGSTAHYPAKLVWYDRNMDVAILASEFEGADAETISMGYIKMRDRIVDCKAEDKLFYDDIFVIGTPLDLQYKNTLTLGNISNTNMEMVEASGVEIYTYFLNGVFKYTTDRNAVSSPSQVLQAYDNIYENVVMMNCDITNGNSGGGVFDRYGNLIGLATLGLDTEVSGSASMNFLVPIYPIMQVLDRVILQNESMGEQNIYSIKSLGLKVLDSNEANRVGNVVLVANDALSCYFDGNFYKKADYFSTFNFNEEGVIVLESGSGIPHGFIIQSVDKNDGTEVVIKDRNDLIYFLLGCKKGERINFNGKLGLIGRTYTVSL